VPHASSVVTLGVPSLAIAVAAVIVVGYGNAGRALGEDVGARARAAARAAGVLVIWMTLTAVLAARGLLAQFARRPPPLVVLMAAAFVLAVGLGLSRPGARLARGLPLAALVGVHSFRLPLELLMHRAAREGVMPLQMSFGGRNFDIFSGATAIVVAWLLARGSPRWIALAWNLLAVALLAAIAVIAVISTPMVHAFGSEPERLNTWIAYFPFVWLPTVLLVGAVFGHVVLTRRLLASTPSNDRQ
jgi:hypothetical protein